MIEAFYQFTMNRLRRLNRGVWLALGTKQLVEDDRQGNPRQQLLQSMDKLQRLYSK